jgi:hypothetical protein
MQRKAAIGVKSLPCFNSGASKVDTVKCVGSLLKIKAVQLPKYKMSASVSTSLPIALLLSTGSKQIDGQNRTLC